MPYKALSTEDLLIVRSRFERIEPAGPTEWATAVERDCVLREIDSVLASREGPAR